MQNNIVSVLGMKLGDATESTFVLSLNEEPTRKEVEDRIYIQLPSAGIVFDAELDGRIAAIFLYAEGHEARFKGFAGELPEGISFSNSRRMVQDRLGPPSASGGGSVIEFFGKGPVWDRFDRSEYSLHIQYADNERSIMLVTVMRPERVPK